VRSNPTGSALLGIVILSEAKDLRFVG